MASSQPIESLDLSLALQTESLSISEQEGPDDFAQDNLLRRLRIEEWFAIADDKTPFWWH
jgi:hypothetical protein